MRAAALVALVAGMACTPDERAPSTPEATDAAAGAVHGLAQAPDAGAPDQTPPQDAQAPADAEQVPDTRAPAADTSPDAASEVNLLVAGLVAEPRSLDFGAIRLGDPPLIKTVVIVNIGNAPTTGPVDVTVGDPAFKVSGTQCPELRPLQRCALDVTFSPMSVGGKGATVMARDKGRVQVLVPVGGSAYSQ